VNLWVFDLDGTLITSGIDYARVVFRWGLMLVDAIEYRAPHYSRAVFRWGLMLVDAMEHRAPHYEKFIERFRDIDKERFKTMGASLDRFPGSMVEAYREVCRHVEIEPDPVIEQKSWEIGMTLVSEGSPELLQDPGDLLCWKFIEFLRDIDKERFKTMRAHRERFPGSMVEAYRELCRHAGIEPDPAIERRSWEIGMAALSEETYRNRGMIPGVEETLQFLQEQGELLYCVTAGDPVVQWMKWRGYNLRRFFPSQREYRVIWWDKLRTLKKLRKLHQDKAAIMVGDSIGSDLVPADKVGYQPVFVPHPSVWDHGELVNNAPEGTIKLRQISEIRERYEELV
jgi:FMN phosphatase YigB (HAD superfamily)